MLRSSGQSLPPSARTFFEHRFGHDFSRVRVHVGPEAERSAREIGAAAFAVGNDIAFGAGQFRPTTPAGRQLIAHELAHVVQHRTGAPETVRRQLIYASGYASPYPSDSDAAEIASFRNGTWMPSTPDFAASAGGSGGGDGTATLDDLLVQLVSYGVHAVDRLGLIGHGASGGLALSGTVSSTGDVGMNEADALTEKSLKANARRIPGETFNKGAIVTVYSCHSGADQGFLDAMSAAFGTKVGGFSRAILWCIASDARGAIASRGRTALDLGKPVRTAGCRDFRDDITSLQPDIWSSAGVAEEPKPAAPGP